MTQPDFAARNQVDVLLRERVEALTMRWFVATALIGAIAVVLSILANTMPSEVSGFVVTLAWLAGGLLAVLSVVLPRRELADAHLAKWLRLPVDAYRWAKQMRLGNEQKDAFIALPPNEQSVFGLTLLFERPYTMALALSVGVAVVGLVYGLLTRTVLEAAPFLTAALALNCWHYPRLNKLIDRGRALQKVVEEEEQVRALAKLQTPSLGPEIGKRPSARPPRPTPRLRKSRTSDRP